VPSDERLVIVNVTGVPDDGVIVIINGLPELTLIFPDVIKNSVAVAFVLGDTPIATGLLGALPMYPDTIRYTADAKTTVIATISIVAITGDTPFSFS